jgi:hypothetical protein
VRITAQLLESETGAHLWADRYDGKLEDVFDLQDQITEKVVGVVEPSLRQWEIERSRRKRPENLHAYDLYLRALPHVASAMPADASIAAGFLEDALRLDPNYAAAHAFIAWCHEICFMRGGFDEADKIASLSFGAVSVDGGTMWHDKISQSELANSLGKSKRTMSRWAAAGRLPRDPVTGRVIRTEAEQSLTPWVRERRLRELINSLPAGECVLILVDCFGRERCLSIFNLIGDLPGADCDTAGNAS